MNCPIRPPGERRPRDCPPAVTVRVTAKRCALDALTLAEGLLDAALSPCHGAPRNRGYRGGTHATSSPGLHRASRVGATLRWSIDRSAWGGINLRACAARLSRPRPLLRLSRILMEELRDAIALLFKRKG